MYQLKRPIQFRGMTIGDRKVIYGDLVQGNGYPIIRYEGKLWRHVYPDSVAQLVGFDCDDCLVFEDDVLVDDEGNEHIATIYDRPEFLQTLKLRR